MAKHELTYAQVVRDRTRPSPNAISSWSLCRSWATRLPADAVGVATRLRGLRAMTLAATERRRPQGWV